MIRNIAGLLCQERLDHRLQVGLQGAA